MKRRTLIRVFVFSAAAAGVLLIRNVILMRENERALRTVEAGYTHALEELSLAADNISNTLQKQLYAGTADMQAKLSQQLWRDSAMAKAALSQLPMGDATLENTSKFLSQVGNYALSVSGKARESGSVTDDERQRLSELWEFSQRLRDDMWKLENRAASGEGLFAESDTGEPPAVTEGFTEFEEGFDSYPSLVYDGPFSDHIMEKTPLMTKGKDEISREAARARAEAALGVSDAVLSEEYEESGKMPSYVFSAADGSASCAVTKQGGYVSYFLKNRDVYSESVSVEDAIDACDEILKALGYNNMKYTYYENIDHVLTVNYAYCQGEVCCYTDLIKVSAALDTGEIVGLDARGYLVNHRRREMPEKLVSVRTVQKKLSPELTVLSRGLAVIPSDGGEEKLCYEFKCESADKTHVLVYFGAQTGREEQILILYESESGTLTM
ncbi:MAG: germination protein YpeB [Ruminococcus sp.]|nr:germination protein YpeB [Ruminococcus sp.]